MTTAPPAEYWRYRIRVAAMSLMQDDAETFPFDGAVIYSGNGLWKCDPTACAVIGHGPIPPGWYDIGAPFHSPKTGHYAMRLTPWPGNEMYGRSDFEFHGANPLHPDDSSDGCPCTPVGGLWIREHVHESGISVMRVEAA